MASFTFSSSSVKISLSLLLLFFFWLLSTSAGGAATANTRPSPVKCIHHHASLIACAPFLEDYSPHREKQLPQQPTEACCRNYNEIFYGGTPACLCRYLHPEKLKTSFNGTKLMSLHDRCGSSKSVSLYDLCVGIDGKFNGIIEVVNRDRVNQRLSHASVNSV